jgi:uncharacterized protein YggE
MVTSLMGRKPSRARGWLSLAALIAATCLDLATAQAQGQPDPTAVGPQLTVVANSVLEVVPDLATIRLGVIGDAQDQDAALLANAKVATRLITKARQSGVEAKDI